MLMTSCFPASKPSNDSCRFVPLHKPLMRKHYQFVSVDSHSFLLFSVDYYTTKTPTVCFGAGNFTVNSAGMEAAPPPQCPAPIFSLFFYFIYLYISLSTTSQSKEHLVPLGPAVTTLRECHIKAPSIQPAEKRGEQKRRRKKKRENLGQILFHTHTANLSLLMEKAPHTSVVLR